MQHETDADALPGTAEAALCQGTHDLPSKSGARVAIPLGKNTLGDDDASRWEHYSPSL